MEKGVNMGWAPRKEVEIEKKRAYPPPPSSPLGCRKPGILGRVSCGQSMEDRGQKGEEMGLEGEIIKGLTNHARKLRLTSGETGCHRTVLTAQGHGSINILEAIPFGCAMESRFRAPGKSANSGLTEAHQEEAG